MYKSLQILLCFLSFNSYAQVSSAMEGLGDVLEDILVPDRVGVAPGPSNEDIIKSIEEFMTAALHVTLARGRKTQMGHQYSCVFEEMSVTTFLLTDIHPKDVDVKFQALQELPSGACVLEGYVYSMNVPSIVGNLKISRAADN